MSTDTALLLPDERRRSSIELSRRGIQLNSLEDLYRFANAAAETDFVPKDLRGKPMNVLVAMEYCLELGLPLLTGIRNVAVINGRPSMWGDMMLALVQSSGLLEYIHESTEGTPYQDGYQAVCVTKRKGYPQPFVTYFSVADAKRAKLWNKSGPWSEYPDRMLKMRARGFNLRDGYADALLGLVSREEAEDTPDEPLAIAALAPHREALPPDESHPTTDQVKGLLAMVEASGVAKELVGTTLKTHCHIAEEGRVSLKRWSELLTMPQYDEAMAYFERRMRLLVESDVENGSEGAQEIQGSTQDSANTDIATDPRSSNVGPSSAEQLASAEDVSRVSTLAVAHGVDEVLRVALSHYPKGIPLQRLREIEANLRDRIEAQAETEGAR